jgi:hypothetical protein
VSDEKRVQRGGINICLGRQGRMTKIYGIVVFRADIRNRKFSNAEQECLPVDPHV